MTPLEQAEFHCCYAADEKEALGKGRHVYQKFGAFMDSERLVVDLGCGDGASLLWLQRAGFDRVLGVELNDQLCGLAQSLGVPVIQADMVEFMRNSLPKGAIYLYIDVLEHLPFDTNLEVLGLVPCDSRLILQTPYTRSLLGHQFFFNVPSHVAPYSPWVIRHMLERLGYAILAEGTVDGNQPCNWKRRIRSLLIKLTLGIDPDLILAGGNYFVIADKCTDAP